MQTKHSNKMFLHPPPQQICPPPPLTWRSTKFDLVIARVPSLERQTSLNADRGRLSTSLPQVWQRSLCERQAVPLLEAP